MDGEYDSFNAAIDACLAVLRQHSAWTLWRLHRNRGIQDDKLDALPGFAASIRFQSGEPFGSLRGDHPRRPGMHTDRADPLITHVLRGLSRLVHVEEHLALHRRRQLSLALQRTRDPVTGLLRARDWTTALAREDQIRACLSQTTSLIGLQTTVAMDHRYPDGREAIRTLQRRLVPHLPETALMTLAAPALMVCLLPGVGLDETHRVDQNLREALHGRLTHSVVITAPACESLAGACARLVARCGFRAGHLPSPPRRPTIP